MAGSGIIDIRVITESPLKLSLLSGGLYFALASWSVPASVTYALPGLDRLGIVTRADALKAVLVAALVWFVLRYKRGWVLEAVKPDAPPRPAT
ncbi:MAG: hypothetical protein EOP01_00315 [Propionibacteriaceae bacterium]|nr:MAG: hypothetical protein EOP01_00315 [Propionibacteriaceae bacterium]